MASNLKKIVSLYNSTSLIARIIVGLIIGLVLGLVCPGAQWVALLGDLFVGALKAIAPVLVFALVSSALVQGQEKLDNRFALVLALYLVSTLLAAVVAVIGSFMFPQTLVLNVAAADQAAPSGIGTTRYWKSVSDERKFFSASYQQPVICQAFPRMLW